MIKGGHLTKHFTELGFSAVATPKHYSVEFAMYQIEGEYSDKQLCWHRKGASHHPDPVDSIDQADVYLHGHVKWDGCSNWHFDEQDRVMLHGCSRKHLINLGEVMAKCWDWTRELLPYFEGE